MNEEDLPVAVGTHVEVELICESEREHLVFDVVPDAAADFARGLLGASTPLARAILGKQAGSIVPYRVGDAVMARVLRVTPSPDVPLEDAASRRQAIVQEAAAQAEIDSDMAFALAVGSKWGDYDPGKVRGKEKSTADDDTDPTDA